MEASPSRLPQPSTSQEPKQDREIDPEHLCVIFKKKVRDQSETAGRSGKWRELSHGLSTLLRDGSELVCPASRLFQMLAHADSPPQVYADDSGIRIKVHHWLLLARLKSEMCGKCLFSGEKVTSPPRVSGPWRT